jgi:hypothetical protein
MKIGFLDESEGVKSSTRLVFVVGTFISLLLIGYMIYTKAGGPIEIATAGAMLIGTLGGTKYLGTKNEQTINKE